MIISAITPQEYKNRPTSMISIKRLQLQELFLQILISSEMERQQKIDYIPLNSTHYTYQQIMAQQSLKDFVCGCVSGWAQVAVMMPFEKVKVRLINQSTTNPLYNGIKDCFTKILREEGFASFYRGSMSPFLGIGAQVALQFGSNGMIKDFLTAFSSDGLDEVSVPTLEIVFISGLLTGIPSAFVTTPVDRTRILMQLRSDKNGKLPYRGSVHAGTEIYKKFGLRGLYLGFNPTLLRQVSALSVYFGSYEMFMRFLSNDKQNEDETPVLQAFIAGGIAGAASWIFTYPIDYVKTVIQSQLPGKVHYQSAVDCALSQYKKQGAGVFFKGLGVTMARSFPVNGSGFIAFEYMMRVTGRRQTVGKY